MVELGKSVVYVQVVTQVVPSRNFPAGQLEHSVFEGPVQVAHSVSQLSQVFVAVLGYFQAGHVRGHADSWKYRVPEHVRHWVADDPLQVAHVVSHKIHPFVAAFCLNLLVGHVSTH